MKLICCFTQSHERFLNEWFLPTLKDNYQIQIYKCDIKGNGRYMEKDWSEAVLFKSQKIIESIQDNFGDVFVYSDVDIQFFNPTEKEIQKAIMNKDIVCQVDNPKGHLCTGFFALKANDLTLNLWKNVSNAIKNESRDQKVFNRIIRNMEGIKYGYLPKKFFGTGTFNGKIWHNGNNSFFYIPKSPIMFHANYTIGVENKHKLLKMVKSIVEKDKKSIFTSNFTYFISKIFLGHFNSIC